MNRLNKICWLVLPIVMILIPTCTPKDKPIPSTTPPPNSPTPEPIPTISLEARLQIEEDYEGLRQLHRQISTVWETLSMGDNVQCGETFPTISPDRFDKDTPMQDELHRAALDLLEAVQLWQQECNNPRERVPDETINQGVLKTRSAGIALAEIEDFLNRQDGS